MTEEFIQFLVARAANMAAVFGTAARDPAIGRR